VRSSRIRFALFSILVIIVGFFVLLPTSHQLRRQQLLLGTVVEIIAFGPDLDILEESLSAAFCEIARIEHLMSPHLADSDVARLSVATEPFAVAPETAEVLALGLRVAKASRGGFDMTLGRLKQLWAIGSTAPHVPTAAEISVAVTGVGPEALTLNGQIVTKKNPHLAVDLGAIAKGYAIDRAALLLRQRGIKHASVNAGGDIVLLGGKSPEERWLIGIQDPLAPDKTVAALALADRAVVTSGDYERFFERDGVRYHHIFDPASGFPGRRSRSVTIVADSAALADALATAVFVLGPEAGIALLSDFPATEGLIIDPAGEFHLTPGMSTLLSWH